MMLGLVVDVKTAVHNGRGALVCRDVAQVFSISFNGSLYILMVIECGELNPNGRIN